MPFLQDGRRALRRYNDLQKIIAMQGSMSTKTAVTFLVQTVNVLASDVFDVLVEHDERIGALERQARETT